MSYIDQEGFAHPTSDDKVTGWSTAHITVCPLCRERFGGPAMEEGEWEHYKSQFDMKRLQELLKSWLIEEVDTQLIRALGKRDEPAKLRIEVKVVEE